MDMLYRFLNTYGLLAIKNSATVEATAAGINPFHAGGIDSIKTTDKSVIKNTNTNHPPT